MKIKNALAALLAALASSAHATTFSTDASDLWYNANESGWGVNVSQQNEVLFLTFFVYSPNSDPTWFSASDVRFVSQSGSQLTFSGALYETHGPWFGGDFFVRNVQYRQVGTVTFILRNPATATVNYTVDGFNVTKEVTRATWRANNMAGTYLGAWVGTYSNCPTASANGYREEAGTIQILQDTSSMTINTILPGRRCSYTGPYRQTGRLGFMTGYYRCDDGAVGSFQATEMEASAQGLMARGEVTGDYCHWIGRFGGVLKSP